MKDHTTTRMIKDKAFRVIVVLLACFAMLPLLLILYYITRNGIAVINWRTTTDRRTRLAIFPSLFSER